MSTEVTESAEGTAAKEDALAVFKALHGRVIRRAVHPHDHRWCSACRRVDFSPLEVGIIVHAEETFDPSRPFFFYCGACVELFTGVASVKCDAASERYAKLEGECARLRDLVWSKSREIEDGEATIGRLTVENERLRRQLRGRS